MGARFTAFMGFMAFTGFMGFIGFLGAGVFGHAKLRVAALRPVV
jgi:hypothetical protein